MAADIDQLDAIIDKFLDYARPDHAELKPVLLNDVIEACMYALQDRNDIRIHLDIAPGLYVLADEVELARVISNLLENARRYGKTPETGIAVVDIAAKVRNQWVLLKVRDHGIGVAPEALPNLVKPFFRGDAARTAATGAGLGLAIVDKTVQRMGGIFALANTSSGGLAAHIKLQKPRADGSVLQQDDDTEHRSAFPEPAETGAPPLCRRCRRSDEGARGLRITPP
jgi:two-component system osmolarity sensor histidine kinase EnvZ